LDNPRSSADWDRPFLFRVLAQDAGEDEDILILYFFFLLFKIQFLLASRNLMEKLET